MSIRSSTHVRNRSQRVASSAPYASRSGNVRQLYVGNLSYTVSWQILKDHMRKAGDVVRAEVPTDASGRSKGYGLVEYASDLDACNAIEILNNSVLCDRSIFVREDRGGKESIHQDIAIHSNSVHSHNSKVYIGNLPWDVAWQDLKDFLKTAGNVIRADVALDSTGRSKGFGVAEFASADEAQNAISTLNNADLRGRQVFLREDRQAQSQPNLTEPAFIQPANTHQTVHYVSPPPPSSEVRHIGNRVYVGNLAWDVAWQDLKDHFKAVVPVIHSEVFTGKDGRSKGCGIVELQNSSDSITAIARLNNTMLKGRQIFVREDRDETKS